MPCMYIAKKHHVDLAEYRNRLFWKAQQDGFKPLLPWVKRHILQAATFHLAYSVPATSSLKWHRPDSFSAAMPRAEVPCAVCARQDWIENRFRVYLWREADGITKLAEIAHGHGGEKEILTCGRHMCFRQPGEHQQTPEYLQIC